MISCKGTSNSWISIIKFEDTFLWYFNHLLDKFELNEGKNYNTINFEKLISLFLCNSSFCNWSNIEKYGYSLNFKFKLKLSFTISNPF